MPFNIVEIASNNKKLSVFRGFLRIEEEGNVLKDIPFNSINSVIITAFNVIYTNNLLQRLCEENIPLIILGSNYAPNGMLTSYIGQSKQTEIQYLQVENKKPLEKKIWQLIVKEKIKNQSKALSLFHKENQLQHIYKPCYLETVQTEKLMPPVFTLRLCLVPILSAIKIWAVSMHFLTMVPIFRGYICSHYSRLSLNV